MMLGILGIRRSRSQFIIEQVFSGQSLRLSECHFAGESFALAVSVCKTFGHALRIMCQLHVSNVPLSH